jgi:AcrR family transcriptional regulator
MDSESGVREKKKEATRNRISEVGLELFLENGYEETTLDDIAQASGISRRTFFNYFDSKEAVLLAWQGSGFLESIRPAILAQDPSLGPVEVLRKGLLATAVKFHDPRSVALDRLMRSTEALRTKKQSMYGKVEQALIGALLEFWPDREAELRVVAAVASSILRLSIEQWRDEDGVKPMSSYLETNFQTLSQFA